MNMLFSSQDPTTYSVNVKTNQTEEMFNIGSNATLLCMVHPEPPQQVTYRWFSSTSHAITIANSNIPNATVTISMSHPSKEVYFCHVDFQGAILGVGSIVIRVRGK